MFNPLKITIMTKEKYQLLMETLKYSHPYYIGEDFYASVRISYVRDYVVVFYMAKPYEWFINESAMHLFCGIAETLYIRVSIQVENGLPIIKCY